MLNRIVLIGRLTKDPELRTSKNGTPVCIFTLAVNRSYKNSAGEQEADFIPVVVWRKLAETCAQYLAKGKLAAIDGRLQLRDYETNDGTKRNIAEVIAENIRFLSPKDQNAQYTEAVDGEYMDPIDKMPF